MSHKIGKTYIKKGKKISFVIMLIALVIAGVIITVIELLPSSVPELGYSEQNGLGRSFMYPFVFTDNQAQLFALKDNNAVVTVDNNVSRSLHDSAHEIIYYTRENKLYEYSLKTNDRVLLFENAVEFSSNSRRSSTPVKRQPPMVSAATPPPSV